LHKEFAWRIHPDTLIFTVGAVLIKNLEKYFSKIKI
jgi:hypothetical protein